MYKKEILFVIAIVILIINTRAQQEIKQLSKANNDFSFELLKTFPENQNIFFSPASIYVALAMAYGAAREETARQMYNTLQYGEAGLNDENIQQTFYSLLQLLNNGSDEYKLQIANAILVHNDYNILSDYKNLLQTNYNAMFREIDFLTDNQQTVEEINNWVNNKTHGKITKLIDKLSPNAKMILLNAIYFKGIWKKTFTRDSTANEDFFNHGTDRVSAPMMKVKEDFLYASFPGKGYHAIELPYKGEDISMIILLPYEYDSLNQLETTMNSDVLQDVISSLRYSKVDVRIPKFKLQYSKELKGNLQTLGMQNAFNDNADFSGITGRKELYISQIFHKAVIEVNEEGSEAAAVTGIIFYPRVGINVHVTPIFNANHPFLFFIRDRRTNMILFSGRVSSL